MNSKTFLRWVALAFLASLLLPPAVLACVYHVYGKPLWSIPLSRMLEVVPGPAVLAVSLLFFLRWLRRYEGAVASLAEEQAQYLDTFAGRRLDLAIVASAGLSLFFELVMIRWQVGIFPLLAFYKNFALLACFMGLGLGYALSRGKQIPLLATIPLVGFQILLELVLKYGLGEGRLMVAMAPPVTEQLHMGVNSARTLTQYALVYYTLATLFVLTALTFIPVGQLCGRLMTRMGNLRAYGLNLLGSLAGVLGIMAISYLWTPPIVWFGICFAMLLAFQAFSQRALVVCGGAAIATLSLLAWPVAPNVQQIHSPYQMLEREYAEDGLTNVRASGHFLQRVHDFAADKVAYTSDNDIKRRARFYEIPYRVFGAAEKVAIVGAGTGNDAAAALRMGAGHVDAVEIDPAIVEVGKAAHPEGPYRDERVSLIVNDARTYLRQTGERYDLIVYGLLDSHSVLSQASSVRLDSFVYTVEGFREARARLNAGGALSLSFYVLSPELGQKLYLMLKEAFDGNEPTVLRSNYTGFYVYLQAQDGHPQVPAELLAQAEFTDISAALRSAPVTTDVSTDDWPFLYMPQRVFPFSYLGMFGIVLVASLLLAATFLPARPRATQLPFFFLGTGFMLIETKGITELGLHFGNTWQVIGIVIAGILLMAFGANWFVLRFGITRPWFGFALLFAALAAGYLAAAQGGFPSTAAGRAQAVALLTCPMLFSGIVFSAALRRDPDISGLMAANLVGAMVGGVLEYAAMAFGYSSLYLFAIGVYAAAALSLLAGRHGAAVRGAS